VDSLKLPNERCAGYVRRQELNTVYSTQGYLITEQVAQTGMLHLNTDDTTKSQKKLNGIAHNGQTISINEVADVANRIVEDISNISEIWLIYQVLKKLIGLCIIYLRFSCHT